MRLSINNHVIAAAFTLAVLAAYGAHALEHNCGEGDNMRISDVNLDQTERITINIFDGCLSVTVGPNVTVRNELIYVMAQSANANAKNFLNFFGIRCIYDSSGSVTAAFCVTLVQPVVNTTWASFTDIKVDVENGDAGTAMFVGGLFVAGQSSSGNADYYLENVDRFTVQRISVTVHPSIKNPATALLPLRSSLSGVYGLHVSSKQIRNITTMLFEDIHATVLDFNSSRPLEVAAVTMSNDVAFGGTAASGTLNVTRCSFVVRNLHTPSYFKARVVYYSGRTLEGSFTRGLFVSHSSVRASSLFVGGEVLLFGVDLWALLPLRLPHFNIDNVSAVLEGDENSHSVVGLPTMTPAKFLVRTLKVEYFNQGSTLLDVISITNCVAAVTARSVLAFGGVDVTVVALEQSITLVFASDFDATHIPQFQVRNNTVSVQNVFVAPTVARGIQAAVFRLLSTGNFAINVMTDATQHRSTFLLFVDNTVRGYNLSVSNSQYVGTAANEQLGIATCVVALPRFLGNNGVKELLSVDVTVSNNTLSCRGCRHTETVEQRRAGTVFVLQLTYLIDVRNLLISGNNIVGVSVATDHQLILSVFRMDLYATFVTESVHITRNSIRDVAVTARNVSVVAVVSGAFQYIDRSVEISDNTVSMVTLNLTAPEALDGTGSSLATQVCRIACQVSSTNQRHESVAEIAVVRTVLEDITFLHGCRSNRVVTPVSIGAGMFSLGRFVVADTIIRRIDSRLVRNDAEHTATPSSSSVYPFLELSCCRASLIFLFDLIVVTRCHISNVSFALPLDAPTTSSSSSAAFTCMLRSSLIRIEQITGNPAASVLVSNSSVTSIDNAACIYAPVDSISRIEGLSLSQHTAVVSFLVVENVAFTQLRGVPFTRVLYLGGTLHNISRGEIAVRNFTLHDSEVRHSDEGGGEVPEIQVPIVIAISPSGASPSVGPALTVSVTNCTVSKIRIVNVDSLVTVGLVLVLGSSVLQVEDTSGDGLFTVLVADNKLSDVTVTGTQTRNSSAIIARRAILQIVFAVLDGTLKFAGADDDDDVQGANAALRHRLRGRCSIVRNTLAVTQAVNYAIKGAGVAVGLPFSVGVDTVVVNNSIQVSSFTGSAMGNLTLVLLSIDGGRGCNVTVASNTVKSVRPRWEPAFAFSLVSVSSHALASYTVTIDDNDMVLLLSPDSKQPLCTTSACTALRFQSTGNATELLRGDFFISRTRFHQQSQPGSSSKIAQSTWSAVLLQYPLAHTASPTITIATNGVNLPPGSEFVAIVNTSNSTRLPVLGSMQLRLHCQRFFDMGTKAYSQVRHLFARDSAAAALATATTSATAKLVFVDEPRCYVTSSISGSLPSVSHSAGTASFSVTSDSTVTATSSVDTASSSPDLTASASHSLQPTGTATLVPPIVRRPQPPVFVSASLLTAAGVSIAVSSVSPQLFSLGRNLIAMSRLAGGSCPLDDIRQLPDLELDANPLGLRIHESSSSDDGVDVLATYRGAVIGAVILFVGAAVLCMMAAIVVMWFERRKQQQQQRQLTQREAADKAEEEDKKNARRRAKLKTSEERREFDAELKKQQKQRKEKERNDKKRKKKKSKKGTQFGFDDALQRLGLPGWLLVVPMWILGPPSAMAAATLWVASRFAPSSSSTLVANVCIAAGVLFFGVLPLSVYLYVGLTAAKDEMLLGADDEQEQQAAIEENSNNKNKNSNKTYLTKLLDWAVNPRREWQSTTAVFRSWGFVYDAHALQHFAATEYLVTVSTSVAGGIIACCRSESCCESSGIASAALVGVNLALLLFLRPPYIYLARIESALNITLTAATLLVIILGLALSSDSNNGSESSHIVELVAIISLYFGLALSLLPVAQVCVAVLKWLGKRWRNDNRASEPQGEELLPATMVTAIARGSGDGDNEQATKRKKNKKKSEKQASSPPPAAILTKAALLAATRQQRRVNLADLKNDDDDDHVASPFLLQSPVQSPETTMKPSAVPEEAAAAEPQTWTRTGPLDFAWIYSDNNGKSRSRKVRR